jgi:hypothetical protein
MFIRSADVMLGSRAIQGCYNPREFKPNLPSTQSVATTGDPCKTGLVRYNQCRKVRVMPAEIAGSARRFRLLGGETEHK